MMLKSMKTRKATRRGFRPGLESIESRLVLSTLFASPTALDGAANSLRAAIVTANNQNSGIVNILAAPGTYHLTEGDIEVDGAKITISPIGPGKVNIVASSNSEIFDLEGGNLTLNGVGLSGGNNTDSEDGGAIYVASGTTLTANACNFTNNYAEEYGGAIYNDGTLFVNSSTFTNNNAYDDGGAIDNEGYASITHSTFATNTSEYGGAIYSEGPSSTGIVNRLGVVPLNISASLIVTSSTFTGNAAYYEGGAVDGEDIEVFTGDTFTSNTTDDEEGGALYNDDSMLVNNCSFTGNLAEDSDAGAIYNDGGMTINASTFTNNSSLYDDGGAIYNDDSLLINGSAFTGNTASDDDGGAIYNDDSLAIRNTTFSKNQANDGDGGALYNNSTLSVVGGTFTSNYASDTGSAIENYSEATATISASTFTRNAADAGDGYTIDNDEMCGDGPTLTMTNCTVTGNDQGVDNTEYSTLNLNGCRIVGNQYYDLWNDGTTNASLTQMGDNGGSGTINYNP